MLASCNKQQIDEPKTDGANPDGTFTFNLALEEPLDENGVQQTAKARETVSVSRYILEIYKGDTNGAMERQENNTGTFNVIIDKGIDYVCLFWADGGAADYNATSLKAVSQITETATGKPAYYARKVVNSKNFDGNVSLTHAVAEMVFVETVGFAETGNTLVVTYPFASSTFNLSDGTVARTAGTAIVRTFGGIGAVAANGTVATDYILAPEALGIIDGLKFQFNTEDEKTIAQTPVQAKYRTRIKGEFAKPKPQAKPQVGDFYYDNNTYSSTYDNKLNFIGVVYWIDPNNPDKGKIVSTHKGYGNHWSTEKTLINAKDMSDGAANTAIILASSFYQADPDKYPAFKLCATKNLTAINGIKWYIPARYELKDKIYPAKKAVNNSLSVIDKTNIIINGQYMSSTKDYSMAICVVNMTDGYTNNPCLKIDSNFCYICFVSDF